jgi:predicted amidohydrolase
MQNLKVSILQSDLFWEDVDANLAAFTEKFKHLNSKTDLVVMPEMFASGFTMKAKEKIAESYNNVLVWMLDASKTGTFVLMGSTIYCEKGKYYNRFIVAQPDGSLEFYDKRHLFSMGAENNHFTPGKDYIIVDVKGWKVRPFVCYDLRFPVWCRNTDAYDIAIFSANWPEARREAWMTLLKARAIENQAYVLGVNCVGKDGNNLVYSGDAAIYNYLGEKEMACEPHKDCFITKEISYERLYTFRNNFPVLNDMDDFEIINK